MSRATAYVRFNDTGNLYFGGYCGTCDFMKRHILPLTKENIKKYPCSHISVAGVQFFYEDDKKFTEEELKDMDINDTECEIYTNYGSGFWWQARGNEKYNAITAGFSPEYNPYEETDKHFYNMNDGEPWWLEDVKATIDKFMTEIEEEEKNETM